MRFGIFNIIHSIAGVTKANYIPEPLYNYGFSASYYSYTMHYLANDSYMSDSVLLGVAGIHTSEMPELFVNLSHHHILLHRGAPFQE